MVLMGTDGLLDRGELAVENARAGQFLDVIQQAWFEAGEGFKLLVNGEANATQWEATLGNVLDRKPISAEVADAWRDEIKIWETMLPRGDKMSGKLTRMIQVDAMLTLAGGEQIPVDAMITGGQVRKLLGLTLSQRAKDFFLEKVLGQELVERPVSLDSRSSRPSVRGEMSTCARRLMAAFSVCAFS